MYVTVLFCFQVIKNPVSDHLPLGCKKYGTSFHVEKVTNPRDIVPEKEPVVIVIGALSHGSVSYSEFRAIFFFLFFWLIPIPWCPMLSPYEDLKGNSGPASPLENFNLFINLHSKNTTKNVSDHPGHYNYSSYLHWGKCFDHSMQA